MKGHLHRAPGHPETLHYEGGGIFSLAGEKTLDLRESLHGKLP